MARTYKGKTFRHFDGAWRVSQTGEKVPGGWPTVKRVWAARRRARAKGKTDYSRRAHKGWATRRHREWKRKEETARKACLDIMSLPKSDARPAVVHEKKPNAFDKDIEQIPDSTASKLLEMLAKEKTGINSD